MTALAKVREILANGEIDAFIVGSGDAHQSEYVSDNNMRRQYVSKFTGSAGTALILKESAFLWTDGRYFLQASTQLSPDWTLMKSGEKGVLELNDWLVANMKSGQTVGIDAWLLPAAQVKALEKKLKEKGIELKSIAKNPIDEVWSLDGQPSIPKEPVIFMEDAKVGQSLVAKLDNLRKDLAEVGANALVVSMLDEVCWLFNIRGSDVSYNPVVYSYAVVTTDKSYLFVDETKISVEVKKHLGDAVLIQPYDSVEEFLKSLSAQGKVWVDANQINWRLYSCLGSSVLDKTSPITMKKSVKNSAELDGMRACHLRDGVALTAFLHWLGKTVKENPFSITEYEAAEKALEFRARMEGHIGPSFDTIAGYASNGAIIHYKPEKETSAKIGDQSLFLLDSGSQYEDGTTDVTRTVHFGEPTEKMKECFTMVLKGHIGLARAVFPEGTVGSRLDCLARMGLWQYGLDYNHGTGHGVGHFLNVHEGPQGISPRRRDNEAGFYANMTTSNEPGYYENGNFGIRIENICIVIPIKTQYNFNGNNFIGFETMTLAPIQPSLVKVSMLDDAEIKWMNDYHATVREKLLPLMHEKFPETVEYLLEQTEAIIR